MCFLSRLLGKHQSKCYYNVFESEEMFRERHKKEFAILENDENKPEGILLYDFSQYYHKMKGGIIVPYPICKTQLQNTNLFRYWFDSLFEQIHNEREVVKQEVAPLLENHFMSYVESLKSQNIKTREDWEQRIRLWHKTTTVLILDIFYKTSTQASDPLLIRDILKRALWGISRCMEDLLYPKQKYDNSFVALYNLWGEQYQRMRSELLNNQIGLSEQQRALLNNDENKEYFNLKYCVDFETPICKVKQPKDYYLTIEIEAMKFFESLFNDYIKRLRRSGIYDEVTTIHSIEEWKDVTLREIDRISLIDIISTVLMETPQAPVEDLRNANVTQVASDKINNINSLKTKCSCIINGMIENYRRQIHDGCLNKIWSVSLSSLGIDYTGMYSSMIKEKIIAPDFEFTAFEDAFRSADFSLLLESANFMDSINLEKGRPGLIKHLVKVIGESVGNDWYYSAAESINPKYKGKEAKFAIEKLKPTAFLRRTIPKTLEGRIPGYKY